MSRRSGVMLCYPFEEKRLAKWKPPFICQPKFDGERCRAILDENGHPILLSSEENIIESVPHISDALRRSGLRSVELDGELYTHGFSFEKIHGIVSRKRNLHDSFEDLQYHVFDIVNDESQLIRTIRLGDLPWRTLSADAICCAPSFLCNNLTEVIEYFDHFCAEGYEGIIVRSADGLYKRSRSTKVMKFKPKQSDFYMIVDTTEEIALDGTPKNRLGALVCISQVGEERFNVGTGFSATQREELWAIRDKLPGNFVHVKYQHTTPGRGVPRFPVYSEILWTRKDTPA